MPEDSNLITGDVGRDWASSHRWDASTEPGSANYAWIRGEMTRLEEKFKDLQAQMEQTSIQYSRLAWQVAPVRRLPPELLGHIFFHLVGESGLRYYDIGTPKALLSTCSRWRDVALGTPRLWRAINIDDKCHYDFDDLPAWPDFDAERLCSWIERAKSLPLRVRVESFEERDPGRSLFFLAQEYARWESLSLEGQGSIFTILSSFGGDPTRFEPGQFKIGTPLKTGLGEDVYDFKSLTMLEATGPAYFRLLSIRAEALAKIIFSDISIAIADYMDMVQGTPNVQSIKMSGVLFTTEDPFGDRSEKNTDMSRPIGHKHLRHLTFNRSKIDADGELSVRSILFDLIRHSSELQHLNVEFKRLCGEPHRSFFSDMGQDRRIAPVRFAASNVTSLHLVLGRSKFFGELRTAASEVTQFLHQFVSLQTLDIGLGHMAYAADRSGPDDIDHIVKFSHAFFGAIIKMTNLDKLFLGRIIFPKSHLLFLAKTLYNRAGIDNFCMWITSNCIVLDDRFLPTDFQSTAFDERSWSEFDGPLFPSDEQSIALANQASYNGVFWAQVQLLTTSRMVQMVKEVLPPFNIAIRDVPPP